MFVYYFVTIGARFDRAGSRFLHAVGSWDRCAGDAYREGEELRVRIGPGLDRQLFAKTVRLNVGTPVATESDVAIPIVWEATGARVLFPRMEGDLILAALGPDLCQLTLRGSYRPPLGPIGRAIDRTILHRVAEASVRSFVERIAAPLSADVAIDRVAAGGDPGLPEDPAPVDATTALRDAQDATTLFI
jgi:hypothetical protein